MLFILEQHVSQVLSEDSSERGRERDVGTPRKSRRERQRKKGRKRREGGEKKTVLKDF